MLDAFLALASVELSFEILDLLLEDGDLLPLLFIGFEKLLVDLNEFVDLGHIA